MVEAQMATKDKNQKLRTLNQFLCENSLDRRLSAVVKRQVTARLSRRDKLTDNDVPALTLLSSSLRAALRFDLFQEPLLSYPLFRLWGCLDMATVHRSCLDAMNFVHFSSNDDLFAAGTEATKAYVVADGSITYTQVPGTSPV